MQLNKKKILWPMALFLGLLMILSAVRAQDDLSQRDDGQENRAQVEQREWSAEDVTGAWEVALRSYIVLPEKDAVPDYQIEEIEELNKSLENRKVIERFSDEVYNHFEFDEGGQNSIYDRPSDRLFIYYSGEDSAYFFNFEQYQNDFLDEEEGSSQWPVYEVMSEPQSPILGFEVKEARIGGDESPQSDGGTGSVYWVAPELPVWFDKLKGVTLPGYPLRRAETTYIEGIKMSFYVEVVDIRPIDPKELVLTPPKELELLPWDSLQEDELYLFGIETQEEEDG